MDMQQSVHSSSLTWENQVTEQAFVIEKPMFVGEYQMKGDGVGTGVELRDAAQRQGGEFSPRTVGRQRK